MVIYEITAVVEQSLTEAYEKYMRERHIPDLLATGFFQSARLARSSENRYRVQYHARDRRALDDYLSGEAERLRADFLAHFPVGIELSREIWAVVQSWSDR